MNQRVMHAIVAVWMLCMAGSAAAQCQAGMPTVPGAGCVPREYIENSRGGGYPQQPQYAPEAPPPRYRDIPPPPIVPVIEYGAHVLAADNKSLFGGTGYLSARDAQEGVLRFCEERSGTACRSLGFFKDTCQGFAFDRQNRPYKGVDTDPRQAVRQAMAACVRESGKGQCQLQKLPICAGNDYVGSDFNASKKWGPGEYEAQVRSWTATAERGLR
ncbi:DUF4189 domain-containing protein [Variovorax sp. GB1P17]|uniref:DUF4189 domain-containing protein n=1 Tax=Variovorax sp. GB1P17 TaxID=3443740 RepID=UPI003F453028